MKFAGRPLMTLPEQIAERIFTAIAGGEYAPGERIREDALADRYEVSRGPVREALRILEKDSVVRILPNRGAHVTQLSIKEVGDIFEIRRDLAVAAVRRLAAQRDAARIATIEFAVRELEALAKEPASADEYVALSFRLSGLVADSCGNERLAEIMDALARQTRRYATLSLASPARRKASARGWRALLKALAAGDPEAAAAAIESLLDASRQEAIRQLEAAAEDPTDKDFVQ